MGVAHIAGRPTLVAQRWYAASLASRILISASNAASNAQATSRLDALAAPLARCAEYCLGIHYLRILYCGRYGAWPRTAWDSTHTGARPLAYADDPGTRMPPTARKTALAWI